MSPTDTSALVGLPADAAWWRPRSIALDLHGPRGDFVPRPNAWLRQPIFDSFEEVAARQPRAPALSDDTDRLTYEALRQRARSLAERVGTQPPGAVATVLDEAGSIAALLACFAAGRTCLTLNPSHPTERIERILADAQPTVILRPGAPMAVGLPSELLAAFQPPDLHAPAAVIYTSGSTGQPKGIVRSQWQLLHRVDRKIRQFHLGPDARVLTLYSLTTSPGMTHALMTLLSGGSFHLARISELGPRGVLDLVARERITLITGLPSVLRLLFRSVGATDALVSVRGVFTASEALPRADAEAWRAVLPAKCAVLTDYGLTEGGPLADWFLPPDLPGDGAQLPVGYPNPWFNYALTDADGAAVAPGEAGELWVRGRLLAFGEWQAGRCLPGHLVADPADPSLATFRTGDLLRQRPDGLLEFMGRADAQVKIRGNRVEPAEIEAVLRLAPGVADVAVLALPADDGGVVLIACVVGDNSQTRLQQALTERLRTALPSYMLPRRIDLVPSLPRLANGKVDTRTLAARINQAEPFPGS